MPMSLPVLPAGAFKPHLRKPLWHAFPALLLLFLTAGCSTLTVDRVDPEALDAKVEYRRLPDQVEVAVAMRAGFWNRRVTTGTGELALVSAEGVRTPLEPTRIKGRYIQAVNISNGPYELLLHDGAGTLIGHLALPLGPAIELQDPENIDGSRLPRDAEITLPFENPTDEALYWSFSARCGDDEWRIARQLEDRDNRIDGSLRLIKQQLDRSAGANLLGDIPVTITLYQPYPVASSPPFQVREARAQDSVSFTLTGPSSGLSISGGVRLQVAPNAFFGIGAGTPRTRSCR